MDFAIAVQGNDKINEAGIEFLVIGTPGHSPDAVCYLVDNVLFSGDTLFRLSIGRCDLAGGDMKVMEDSLKKIKNLPFEDLTIYPGHMSQTSLMYERNNNEYLR